MRLPWNKSKSMQLDLLDDATAVEPPQPQPVRAIAAAGAPMLVSVAAIFEDPDNPRTEVSETEIDELAADIRQRGILQPIVVHPPDDAGRYRIHFGARRWRAAQRAGMEDVPVVVRDAPADPYAQVAENHKRHGLTPLDLARFIRGRIETGESNSEVARRLGMNLTTVAHHLALLELPPVLDDALKSGRCRSPRTLHELGKLHDQDPEPVESLLASGAEITRAAVSGLRATRAARLATAPSGSAPAKCIAQAIAACDRLEQALERLALSDLGVAANPDVATVLARLDGIARRWQCGSDRQTP